MSEVLFEIRKENLETGLRGYPVGYCTTSTVDPFQGLFYSGFPLYDIDRLEPEEVIYLLYYGRKGAKEEIEAFSNELKERATCCDKLLSQIQHLPREADAMQLFSAALLFAAVFEGENQYREDALNLIAKAPHIVATVINHHAGWGPTKSPQSDLGYIENFMYMLNLPGKKTAELLQALKLFNILHYDHGGGNLSAFVGKAVASSLEDLYGSMAAAMCALAGPRHGRANRDCLLLVQQIVDKLGEEATEEEIESLIKQKMANHELIPGFGHAVLRVEDPRATLLYQLTQAHFPNHPLVKVAHLLRRTGHRLLQQNPKIACPYPNVDAISGVMLSVSGFPYPEYFTLLFGLARVVGISRQIVYEREEAKEGRGTPIVRPKYLYLPETKKAHEQ